MLGAGRTFSSVPGSRCGRVVGPSNNALVFITVYSMYKIVVMQSSPVSHKFSHNSITENDCIIDV